jgi:Protein of unknown function (DUF2934)
MEAKLNQTWPQIIDETEGPVFLSPTAEGLSMQFALDCGGIAQAEACLDAWALAQRGGGDCANRRERISESAYFRWIDEGQHHGHDLRHWCEAESAYDVLQKNQADNLPNDQLGSGIAMNE